MSHRTNDTHTLAKQGRHDSRTQLNRIRCTYSEQGVGYEDWIEEVERYLSDEQARQSIYRKRAQSGRMGQEVGEQEG